MKVASKPISSPGRAEKFPPPLMRFLRSNAGSKSRGRSRSSSMFLRKRQHHHNSAAIETQEPSSPKVTCIGQVRVKRSSKQPPRNKPNTIRRPRRRHYWWVRKLLFCPRLRLRWPRPDWRKWVLILLRPGCFRKVETADDYPKMEANQRSDYQPEKEQQQEEAKEETEGLCSSSTPTPPKNALLLTRCRSAPYRSSSLASRFWDSPLTRPEEEAAKNASEEEEEEQRALPLQQQQEDEEEDTKKALERDPKCGDSRKDREEEEEEEEEEEKSEKSKEL